MKQVAVILAAFAAFVPLANGASTHGAPPKRGLRGTLVFNRFFDAEHDSAALFTINVNGNAERQLTHPPDGVLDLEPVWSPNGKRVAFQRTESGATAVYLVGADGQGTRRLLPDGADETDSPAWSPSGSQLAVGLRSGDREVIAIVSPAGKVLRQVTQRTPAKTPLIDSQPGWSPDGKRLTFVRQTADPSKDGLQALFIVNGDGTHARRLTPWALRAGHHPNWSPDGKQIMFTSNADGADSNLPANIYSVRPNGKGLRQLTRATAGQRYLSSSFAPNGRWITFALQPSPTANAQVFVMRPNGTNRRAITNPSAWSSAPDWSSARSRSN